MEYTWRWFGPDDPITLTDIRQMGVTGIVTALHHLAPGVVWSCEEILTRKTLIENAGLRWSVVESVPVHEDIKLRRGSSTHLLDNYKLTIRNLASCGIKTICYNFMPVLDWTRTHLAFLQNDGAEVLRFDYLSYVLFDLFILKRTHAVKEYTPTIVSASESLFASLSSDEIKSIQRTILMGLPGTVDDMSLDDFKSSIAAYHSISRATYEDNYAQFVNAVIPTAESTGTYLAIHPDDPPFSLFGLHRIVSSYTDIERILSIHPSTHHGITLCTGSLGAHPSNDLRKIAQDFASRIHFVHLRNVAVDPDGSFQESPHLCGEVDMVGVLEQILIEDRKRVSLSGRQIPMRPDHGSNILTDHLRKTYPGYSAIGRLKGLSELKGLEAAIATNLG